MKQKDFQTLSETAAIVDFLSKGLILLTKNEIIQLEFQRYKNPQLAFTLGKGQVLEIEVVEKNGVRG